MCSFSHGGPLVKQLTLMFTGHIMKSENKNESGTLYVVATPIGNLEDVTLRALDVLKTADVIVCEDTRVTKKLLNKYEIINKRLMAYNEHRSGASSEKIIALLEAGNMLAVVSDSGTPAISDPGSSLIARVLAAGFLVRAVPGPSALAAALSISGLPASDFLFLGFLPRKKGRARIFKEIAASKRTVILYESPHRILKTLETLSEYFGENRRVVIIRELTKIYEEIISGTHREALRYFKDNLDRKKGEFVIIVNGRR